EVQRYDSGWDYKFSDCPKDDAAKNLPFGSECYRPDVIDNVTKQFFLANGSEGNLTYDTEDLNNNGRLDETNSYFGITLNLNSDQFVITDVDSLYRDHPISNESDRQFFEGWRKYRIDLTPDVLQHIFKDNAGVAPPNLRRISTIRIWFEDTPGTTPERSLFNRNIQLFDLRLTRNQWLDVGVFGVDSTQVLAQPGESFTV